MGCRWPGWRLRGPAWCAGTHLSSQRASPAAVSGCSWGSSVSLQGEGACERGRGGGRGQEAQRRLPGRSCSRKSLGAGQSPGVVQGQLRPRRGGEPGPGAATVRHQASTRLSPRLQGPHPAPCPAPGVGVRLPRAGGGGVPLTRAPGIPCSPISPGGPVGPGGPCEGKRRATSGQGPHARPAGPTPLQGSVLCEGHSDHHSLDMVGDGAPRPSATSPVHGNAQ